MKIAPVPQGKGGQTTVNPNVGQSASPEKIARAKAVITGQPVPEVQQEQRQESVTEKLKRIKMKTNVTPAGRDWEPPAQETAQEAHISAESEPAPVTSEDPKPLSPQFAALAKHKRALDVREKAIQAREEALKQDQGSQATMDAKALVERIKADPLGIMLEHGVTYDQLTKQVIASMEGASPELSRVETQLRSELKGLKEVIENQSKTHADEKTAQEQRVLAIKQRQADQLIAGDDAYMMIRETGSNKDVTALIDRVLKDEGLEISVQEACELVENDLLEESLKIARITKVQQKLMPEPALTQQTQAANTNDGIRRQTMRTLTNRDTVSAIPSRRDRAIAAALGKKIA